MGDTIDSTLIHINDLPIPIHQNNIVYYLQRHLGTCEIITCAEFGAKIKE